MIRKGFLLRLKPGAADEYRAWHQRVPRQVEDEEEAAGVIQETIFIHEDLVFVFSVLKDEGTWDRARNSPASVEWSENMARYLVAGSDGHMEVTPLAEVYHHVAPSTDEPPAVI